jgi:hypothetical protein
MHQNKTEHMSESDKRHDEVGPVLWSISISLFTLYLSQYLMTRRASQRRSSIIKKSLLNSHERLSIVWQELQVLLLSFMLCQWPPILTKFLTFGSLHKVPIIQKLEFMEKYSTLQYATELASVIPLWERCATLVVAREVCTINVFHLFYAERCKNRFSFVRNGGGKCIIDKIKALQQGHISAVTFPPYIESILVAERCLVLVNPKKDESEIMRLHRSLAIVSSFHLYFSDINVRFSIFFIDRRALFKSDACTKRCRRWSSDIPREWLHSAMRNRWDESASVFWEFLWKTT